jgi:hypothetical protein
LCSFLQPPVTSSLFGTNVLLRHPQSMFSLSVKYQISQLCRTTGKIIVSYIPYFTFLDSRWEDERCLDWMVASVIQIRFPLNFLLTQILICYCHSQVFELWQIFKGSVSYHYIMILPCILVSRQQHILAFHCS